MAIRELLDSLREHDTTDGWTVNRHFVCLWSDWINGFGNLVDGGNNIITANFFFPTIGDELVGRPHITVSDRTAEAVDNVLVNINITYSTKSREARSETENQIASWEEELDISLEEVSVLAFFNNADTPLLKSWKTLWTDQEGSAFTDETRPDLILLRPKVVLNVTAYSNVNFRKRILDNVGKVNDTLLLATLAAKKQLVDPKRVDDVDGGYDDIEKWIFYGARMRRVRNTSYQYAFTFVYDGDGWNTFQGVDIDHYKTFDMVGLLDSMDNVEEDFHNVPRV